MIPMQYRRRKLAAAVLSLALALSVALAAPVSALAAETGSEETAAGVTVLTVTAEDIQAAKQRELTEEPLEEERYGDGRAIQDALDTARVRATEANPYVVKVKSGTYQLVRSLHIYSNTTLELYGVIFNHHKTERHVSFNLLRIGDIDTESTGVTGYYYRNVTIDGGTFDGCYDSNTIIKLTHAKNVTLRNVIMRSNHNAHIIETAGVDGLTVRNCIFKDQIMDAGTGIGYEALQLDVLKYGNIYDARSEDLPMKHVTVENCRFENCPRGVGSHTSILNAPHSDIRICNNTFVDMKSAAIQTHGWINCTIARNTIYNTPRGIAVYSIKDAGKGTFKPGTLAQEGNTVQHYLDGYYTQKTNIVIDSNTITNCGTIDDIYATYPKAGISVVGGTSQAAYEAPAGDYFCDGVTITNNLVESGGIVVRLEMAKNVNVDNNVLSHPGNSTGYDYGISCFKRSTGCNIRNNYITGTPKEAIKIDQNASATNVSGNDIRNASAGGICVSQNSSVINMEDNAVNGSAGKGISVVKKAVVGRMSGNRIQNAETGVMVEKGSSVTTMTQNTIIGCKTTVDFKGSGSRYNNRFVSASPTSVTFRESAVSMKIGDDYRPALIQKPNYATTTYAYTSSNADIASVDATTGRIVAKAAGSTVVTVRSGNGKTAELTVTVEAPDGGLLLGDVDQNRLINATDAAIIAGYVSRMKQYPSIDIQRADVNRDGAVNAKDRILLTRYADRMAGFEALLAKDPGVSGKSGALSVGSGETAAGDTVSVDVMLDVNPGIVSMDFDIEYDSSVLTLERMTDHRILTGASSEHTDNLTSPCHLAWLNDLSNQNDTAQGRLTTLVFRVAEGAATGTYPINITGAAVFDRDAKSVPFACTAGTVTVKRTAFNVDVTLENAAAQDAAVTLTGADGALRSAVMVEEGGVFRLTDVPAGDHTLRVTSGGCLPYEAALHVTDDLSLTVALQKYGDVNRDGAVDETDLALLTDALEQDGGASLDGAADVNADGAVNEDDKTVLTQFLGGTITELPHTGDIEPLPKAVTVSGRVNGSEQAAVVELVPAGETEPIASVPVTEGAYAFTGVAAGDYLLRVVAEGCPILERTVTVEAQDLTVDFTFRLRGDANADGVVDINDCTAIQCQLAEFADVADAAAADVDGDGVITITDVTALQRILAEFT